MGDVSSIEWTDATWNPVVGCARVSPGCDHCYAARESAGRLRNLPRYAGLAERVDGVPEFTGEVRMVPEVLEQPLHWSRPRRIFVNSMSDLFHPGIARGWLDQIFEVMEAASQHQFQILTKRPVEAFEYLWGHAHKPDVALAVEQFVPGRWYDRLAPEHIWLGTSIESDRYVFRTRSLVRTPAAVRFLSLEPLLGPLPRLDLTDVDWVIVGGESGPRARPMHPAWVRDIRARCALNGIPFLFKQWGEWCPAPLNVTTEQAAAGVWMFPDGQLLPGTTLRPFDAELMIRPGKRIAGRLLDGRHHDGYPRELAARG